MCNNVLIIMSLYLLYYYINQLQVSMRLLRNTKYYSTTVKLLLIDLDQIVVIQVDINNQLILMRNN